MIKFVRAIFLAGLAVITSFCVNADTIAYATEKGGESLWQLNLSTGEARFIGNLGFDNVNSLAFDPFTGTLFGVHEGDLQLITINPATGVGTVVGPLGIPADTYPGISLAFDNSGNLFMATTDGNFYAVDVATGAASLIGPADQRVICLAFWGRPLLGIGGDSANNLLTINPRTGEAKPVGPFTTGVGDIAFDSEGILWGAEGDTPATFTIDVASGQPTFVASTASGPIGGDGWSALAIPRALSVEELVPCGESWKSHGQYLSAVKQVAEAFLEAGLITEDQKKQIIGAAANSDCGR